MANLLALRVTITIMSTFATLQKFAIANLLHFEDGTNGLTRAIFTTPHAEAHVYLHGAHLTHYQPSGQNPVLFLSQCSEFAPAKAIRGGVPIIFPWFGAKQNDASAPSHGFARLMDWEVIETKRNEDDSVTLALRLVPDEETQKLYPNSWALSYHVTVGKELHLALEVRNEGDITLQFEEALHTYFVMGDVHRVNVEGLGDTEYLDKTEGMRQKRQSEGPLHITEETDRVYLDTRATCVINDPDLGRRITIEKSGSGATVVWNPAQVRGQKMTDLCDDEWPHFLCVESGNIRPHTVTLAPQTTHVMSVTISST